MKSEVLKAISVLKDYQDDKRLNDIRIDLERAYNLYAIEMLSTISQFGKELGYENIRRLIKDYQEIVDSLEPGNPNGEKR